MSYRYRLSITRFFYRGLLKPLFFLLPPELAHDLMILFAKVATRIHSTPLFRWWFYRRYSALRQSIAGLEFPSPIGLAAGLDKNADLVSIVPTLGFGLMEVGSITAVASPGNQKPRLRRLPKARSIQVNYGLANLGVGVIAAKLSGRHFNIPLGTNIAYSNLPDVDTVDKAIEDYVTSFVRLSLVGDYFTVNISCPNISKRDLFANPRNLDRLLSKLDLIPTGKRIFLKISADWDLSLVDQLAEVAKGHRVTGFVCTNLTKDKLKLSNNGARAEAGGLSGAVVSGLSDNLIAHIYKNYGHQFVVIGCGGVFSAADAYRKIKLGASLVQLVTGLIFEGPQLAGEINAGLVRLLKHDGYQSIAEAVGSGV